jgi:hypothetical protein
LLPEQRTERLRSHHRAWIPIIAVHEAYPGHHVQALKANENPRLLRKVVKESIFGEGWGLFCEELMYEQGFLKGDDVRLTQLRNRLWRAARVIIDVGIHTGSMTVEEGVQFLVDAVRFERYAAEIEVGMYTRRPTMVLGYLIGMMEIQDMREAYARKFGAPAKPKDFYDKLLRIGSLPPALVRAELLSESALAIASTSAARTQPADDSLGAAGLWRYETLGRPGAAEFPLDGYFLFRDGRFVQQSLDRGEPSDQQVAQAHAGSYRVDKGELAIVADVGLIVTPSASTPVASTRDGAHRLSVRREDDHLTLTFGSGTVQKLRRVGPGEGEVILLERGSLALVDGRFILVAETGSRAVAGSGTFERRGSSLQLVPERWFTTFNGLRYGRAGAVHATIDPRELRIDGEPPLRVVPR